VGLHGLRRQKRTVRFSGIIDLRKTFVTNLNIFFRVFYRTTAYFSSGKTNKENTVFIETLLFAKLIDDNNRMYRGRSQLSAK
jgi:hypothetical protein